MSTPGRKRNQRACTACRQVKHRCDSAEMFPAACSRCQEKDLRCKSDPNFKRTKTRGRLVEVTTQLNAIQKALNEREISVDVSRSGPTAVASDHGSNGVVEEPPLSSSVFYRCSEITDFPSTPPCLGVISLQNEQLRDLFDHFERNYYQQFPILDTDISLAGLCQSSPILFWTIIIISCRWHPSLFHLYPSLITGYRDVLAKTLLEPLNTIQSIQAILMLCFWPFDFRRRIEDPSWSYCGLATNAATKMRTNGLDTHGVSAKDIHIRRKTWIACVHVNCILSQCWNIGVPVLQEILAAPVTLHSSCTPSERKFLAKVEVVRVLAKSSSLLSRVHRNSEAWNLALNLGTDLDSIREQHASHWGHDSEVLLLGAQLCLYTLQLDFDSKARTATTSSLIGRGDNNTDRRNFVNMIYLTAIQLVHKFQFLGPVDEANPTAPSPYRHLPKFYFWLLIMAMAFIFKVRIVHHEALKIKREDTDRHIRAIHDIFSSWSRDDTDHAAQGVKLIDMISKAENTADLRVVVEKSEGRPGCVPGSVVLSDLVAIATKLRGDAARDTEGARTGDGDGEDRRGDGERNGKDSGAVAEAVMRDRSLDWEIPWELDMLSQDPYVFLTGI